MAETIDARVKQKTGVAADFAGYTLLEGEIALVRTSANGPVWNFKVGPGNFDSLDWSLQNPGAAQKADTSTVFPAGVPGLYIPTESGTYDGVSVDLSSGYTQLIWDGSSLVKVEFPIDLSGYATIPPVDGLGNGLAKYILSGNNLFNKSSDVISGKQLSSVGTNPDVTSANTAVSDFIYVGDTGRVFIRRDWVGSPARYHWYRSPDFAEFISEHTDLPAAPGGEITRPTGGRYIKMNLAADLSDLQENIDGLMITISDALPAYAAYGTMVTIREVQQRQESYSSPINAMWGDSALNAFTVVTETHVGRWEIRTAIGASATKIDDYIELDADGITGQPALNAGLLLKNFFTPADVGLKIWYSFEAQWVSGHNILSLYTNSEASRRDVSIDMDGIWRTYQAQGVVGANQYGDARVLLGVQPANTAAVINIRNFRIYFTNPNTGQSDQSAVVNELNLSALANYRYKKASLLNGGTDLLILGLQGDSWTDHVPGAIFYARDLSRLLRTSLGNGGGGWYDFSRGSGSQNMASIDPLDASDTRSGTITYKDQTADAKGVNFAHAEFGNGSSLTLNVLTAHTGLAIHYYGGASYGEFRYRIDGGSWNTVDTSSNSGYQVIANSVSDAFHTVEFEVTSGTCIILGVDMQRSSGIRVHKFGNRGLRTYEVRDVDGSNWSAAIASFNLDAMTILLATNDRTAGRTPSQFKADLNYLIGLYRDGNEFGDLALISPSNNRNTEAYDMQEYANMMVSVARAGGYAFTSIIPLFGSRAQILNKGTFADAVHPTENGGKMIADHLFKVLL